MRSPSVDDSGELKLTPGSHGGVMSSLEPDNLLTVEFSGIALPLNAGATNSVVCCWVSAVTFGRAGNRTAVIAIGGRRKGLQGGILTRESTENEVPETFVAVSV